MRKLVLSLQTPVNRPSVKVDTKNFVKSEMMVLMIIATIITIVIIQTIAAEQWISGYCLEEHTKSKTFSFSHN